MPIFSQPNIPKLKASRDIKGLVRALEYPDVPTREQASQALASLGESALPAIRQAMQNSSINVRCGAAMALAEMRISPAIPILAEGLKNSSRLVRLECIRGLGQVRSSSAIPILQEYAASESDLEIHAQILEALTLLGSPDGSSGLFKLLESSDHNLRIAATQAFSRLGEPVIDFLLRGLKSNNTNVRYACASALGTNRSPRAIVSLIQALVDEDEGVQKIAQESLLKYEIPAAQYLSQALKTKNFALQQAAIRTLKKIPQFAETALITLLSEPNSDLQEIILKLLGEIGTLASVPPLSKLVVSSNPSIRYSAVETLANLAFEECVPHLATAMNDLDEYVIAAAQKGLENILQKTQNPKISRYITQTLQQTANRPSLASHQPQIKSMMEELKKIAYSDGFIGEDGIQFDSLSRHIRTREIGIQLYQLGGHRLMQAVWGNLQSSLNEKEQADLMLNWKEIGGWNAL